MTQSEGCIVADKLIWILISMEIFLIWNLWLLYGRFYMQMLCFQCHNFMPWRRTHFCNVQCSTHCHLLRYWLWRISWACVKLRLCSFDIGRHRLLWQFVTLFMPLLWLCDRKLQVAWFQCSFDLGVKKKKLSKRPEASVSSLDYWDISDCLLRLSPSHESLSHFEGRTFKEHAPDFSGLNNSLKQSQMPPSWLCGQGHLFRWIIITALLIMSWQTLSS